MILVISSRLPQRLPGADQNMTLAMIRRPNHQQCQTDTSRVALRRLANLMLNFYILLVWQQKSFADTRQMFCKLMDILEYQISQAARLCSRLSAPNHTTY